MSGLEQTIERLSLSVDRLMLAHKKSEERIAGFVSDNRVLRQKVEEQNFEIEELNERIKVLKLARSLSADGGKATDVKLRINELVREVDRCIALLNK